MTPITEAFDTYLVEGIALFPDKNEIKIDLSQPRVIRIRGVTERHALTGEPVITKDYFLKVTPKGGLVLV